MVENDFDLDDAIATRIVAVLNDALRIDRSAIEKLTNNRVVCNDALGDHPTIQVGADADGCEVGMLGILNGIAGTLPYKGNPAYGRVEALYGIECPNCFQEHLEEHAMRGYTLVVGDPCPICGAILVMGELLEFRKTPENKNTEKTIV